MKVNKAKRIFVNSAVRRFLQKYWEIPTLIKLGGKPAGENFAEIGCGSGYGVKLIREQFSPRTVHAFEIDEIMLKKASTLLAKEIMDHHVFLHEEDDNLSMLAKNSYGTIFFFGSLRHIPQWKKALKASINALESGGKIYIGEYYKPLMNSLLIRKLFHPHLKAVFTHDELINELERHNCKVLGEQNLLNLASLLVVEKKALKS